MGAADAEEARKATTANAMHGFSPGPLSSASDSHGSSGFTLGGKHLFCSRVKAEVPVATLHEAGKL